MLAPEGSTEQKHALGCLAALLSALQQDFVHAAAQSGWPPDRLQQLLQDSCWAAVRRGDAHSLQLLLQALRALVAACMPCLPAPDAGIPAASHDMDEQQACMAAIGAACRAAVPQCLRLLLVQLPCSQQVPPLIRGLSLEVMEAAPHPHPLPRGSGVLCLQRLCALQLAGGVHWLAANTATCR